jgi:AcrR family transcriptional regulator
LSRPPNPELIEKIILFTIDEIHENGTKNISMRKLSKGVNITPTTIYYYFKNKDDLLDQVKLYAISDLDSFMKNNININKSYSHQLKMAVHSFIDWNIKNYNLSEILFEKLPGTQNFNSKSSREYYKPLFRIISILRNGHRNNEFNVPNPSLLATAGFGWMYGLVKLHIQNIFIPDHRDKLSELTELTTNMIINHITLKDFSEKYNLKK